jgi:nucleoside-diphosphate-sugar epimerase
MTLVIIGGTGLIGSKLVTRLRERGHEAVAASPDTGVNPLTGEGLAQSAAAASERSTERAADAGSCAG